MKRITFFSLIVSCVLSTGVFSQWNLNGTNIYYNNGNVGIGTDSPENADGWEKVLNIYGTNHSKIITTSSLVNTGIWSHNTGYYGAPAGGMVGTFSNHPFSIITNQSAKMTINTNGNVGIGITNPSYKLDVQTLAPTKAAYFQTSGSWQAIDFSSDGGTTKGSLSANAGKLGIGSATSGTDSKITIDLSSGNVGVGTTNPTVPLEVSGIIATTPYKGYFRVGAYSINDNFGYIDGGGQIPGTGLKLSTSDGNSIYGATRMTILNNGNIGIGTTSPSEKIHVLGNVKVDDGVGVGKGIMLQATDRPMVTRGFDPFTSGIYSGIGRWGLFMEPHTLTLGIPNIAGKSIRFKLFDANSSGTELMTILQTGNVGIGTTNPTQKLSVLGSQITLTDPDSKWSLSIGETGNYQQNRLDFAFGESQGAGTQEMLFYGGNANNSFKMGTFAVQANNVNLRSSSVTTEGYLGVAMNAGDIDPNQRLQINGATEIKVNDGDNQLRFHDPYDSWFSMGTDRSDGGYFKINAGGTVGVISQFTMHHNGNILIGDPTAQHALDKYKLNVNGVIRANEVVVNTDGADFVFEENYKLPTLAELEKHIKEKKHLPGIAPASTMQNEGMNVSEMQTKLLQKIEELTLYVIEQQKQIELLKEQNTLIQDNFNQLKK